MNLILILLAQFAMAAPAKSAIQFRYAYWSTEKFITEQLKARCDGKESCEVAIADLGDVKAMKVPLVFLSWVCSDNPGEEQLKALTYKLETSKVQIQCPTPVVVQPAPRPQPAPPNSIPAAPPPASAPVVSSPPAALVDRSTTWTPRSPLKYRSSLHSIFMSSNLHPLHSRFGNACVEAIRSHLQAGKDFSSTVMARRYTFLMADSSERETKDGEFFHYTQADLSQIVTQQNYEEFFQYIRSAPSAVEWFFYVAADPRSTRDRGSKRLTIRMRPDAQIFRASGGGHQGDIDVEREQLEKNPQLEPCRASEEYKKLPHYHPLLTILAAEANQIDMIEYYSPSSTWFQTVGPWSFESMTFSQ